ncbi:GNAT family N-acetyltransferase [Haloferula sp. A504]|uniref:GNAT family N-acetyltransferase n=1 Tax=Haloferula sp. A504 TaxID=3373601 RepID=UPI0031C69B72|nr:GNAT family N-acetyltransferase [Verrucomicrobiaceae bacterium E54]
MIDTTTITTYLEMTDPAQLRPKTSTDPRFRILEATVRQWRFNRFLYELVGTDWGWLHRLSWNDAQWRAYVEDPNVRTFAAYHGGSPAGYFELGKEEDAVQIVYFGLAPAFIGKGLGGVLLSRALEEAWEMQPERVWVHTCDCDHEFALANYQARGMVVYKTETDGPDHPPAGQPSAETSVR